MATIPPSFAIGTSTNTYAAFPVILRGNRRKTKNRAREQPQAVTPHSGHAWCCPWRKAHQWRAARILADRTGEPRNWPMGTRHDLRDSNMDRLKGQGISPDVVARSLDHKIRGTLGVSCTPVPRADKLRVAEVLEQGARVGR